MDALVLHVTKVSVIKLDVISIKENYFIVDSGGATDSLDLVCGFNSPVSIHVYGWCVV